MDASEDSLIALARNMVETVPQAAALGFRLLSVGGGRGSILVPWRADLVGDPATDVIASGVVTSLLDHCCGLAINSSKRPGTSIPPTPSPPPRPPSSCTARARRDEREPHPQRQ